MATVATLEKLSRSANPKLALITEVGDLSKVEILGNRVLVAIYIAPEKVNGLYRAVQTIKEDIFQGVVGLVLKKGAAAFKDEAETNTYFNGQSVEVGDWVTFRPGDAKRIQFRGVDCRMVEDTLIDMRIADPEIITHR